MDRINKKELITNTPSNDDIKVEESSSAPVVKEKEVSLVKKLTFIDLFCGCGGFSYGFVNAGFRHVFGIDNWKGCKETYQKNIGRFVLMDIRGFDGKPYQETVDVVIGSPPCTNFSVANRKKDPKMGMLLINEFYRIVDEIKPKIWIMENVPPISKENIRGFKHIFNANDFGVIQNRIRCFTSNIKLEPIQEGKKFLEYDKALQHIVKSKSRLYPLFNTITTSRQSSITQVMSGIKGIWFATIEERKAIMSFPFNFNFYGTDVWRQIGNAVPPLMANGIALYVKEFLTKENGSEKK